MKAPAFAFYVRDWLSSPSVELMSGDAVKAYMYLLCRAWLETPRATLPNDDRILAALSRVTPEKWKEIRSEVLSCFIQNHEDYPNRIYNDRLLEVSNISDNRALNRKNKTKTKAKQLAANEIENAIAFKSDSEKRLIMAFVYYRKADLRKPFKTIRGVQSCLNKLRKLSGGSFPLMEKIVQQSMDEEWQGVFELKESFNKKPAQQRPPGVNFEKLARERREAERLQKSSTEETKQKIDQQIKEAGLNV